MEKEKEHTVFISRGDLAMIVKQEDEILISHFECFYRMTAIELVEILCKSRNDFKENYFK